jgi:hypothetical protein
MEDLFGICRPKGGNECFDENFKMPVSGVPVFDLELA